MSKAKELVEKYKVDEFGPLGGTIEPIRDKLNDTYRKASDAIDRFVIDASKHLDKGLDDKFLKKVKLDARNFQKNSEAVVKQVIIDLLKKETPK
jgi:hypothetical protein